MCFIQEHWLFDDSLNLVREIDPDFISVGVSGMNCDLPWSPFWWLFYSLSKVFVILYFPIAFLF